MRLPATPQSSHLHCWCPPLTCVTAAAGGHGHQHQHHPHQHHVTFSAQPPQPHHQVSLPPQHLEPQPQAKRQKTGPRAQAAVAVDQGHAAEAHRGPSDAGAPRIGPSLEELNTTLIFEKVLTSSDTNNTGRIVVPKVGAASGGWFHTALCDSA